MIPPPMASEKDQKKSAVDADAVVLQRPPTLKSVRSSMSVLDTQHVRPAGEEGGWDNQIEFLCTCISYAVGLGNVWRFPYLCYANGGGAFVLPYCIMLVLIGLPLFFLELGFGQFASLGPLTIWTVSPLFKGLGYGMITVTLFISLYYNVIIAECLFFFWESFAFELPWTSCGNPWNTPGCIPNNATINSTSRDVNITEVNKNYTNAGYIGMVGTHTEEYYYNRILHMSPDGLDYLGTPQIGMVICLAIAWTICAAGLIKGIKSLGKVAYFTAIYPYVMLTALLIRALTLEGAGLGIAFYLTPQWHRLLEVEVWLKAATQIFFNLSCGTGGLVAMASFNKFKNKCLRDALFVPTLNIMTSIFAGLVVFSILGFMAHDKGTTVEKVVAKGPGLVFIAYPEALSKFPGAPIWSVLFFLMMLTLGFGSELSLVETVLTAFQDDCNHLLDTRKKVIIYRILFCCACFCIGLPMVCNAGIYILAIADYYVSFIALLVLAFLECIVLSWVYGFPEYRICKDFEMMMGRQPPMFYKVMWRVITPLCLIGLSIGGCIFYHAPSIEIGAYEAPSPGWAIAMGWFIALIPLIYLPLWTLYTVYILGGCTDLGEQIKPMVNWGPMQPENRTGRYEGQTAAIEAMLQLQKQGAYVVRDDML